MEKKACHTLGKRKRNSDEERDDDDDLFGDNNTDTSDYQVIKKKKKSVEIEKKKKAPKIDTADHLLNRCNFYKEIYLKAHNKSYSFTRKKLDEKFRPLENKFKDLEYLVDERSLYVHERFDPNIWSNILSYVGDEYTIMEVLKWPLMPTIEHGSIDVPIEIDVDSSISPKSSRKYGTYKLFKCSAELDMSSKFEDEYLNFHSLCIKELPRSLDRSKLAKYLSTNTIEVLNINTTREIYDTYDYDILNSLISERCYDLTITFAPRKCEIKNMDEWLSKIIRKRNNLKTLKLLGEIPIGFSIKNNEITKLSIVEDYTNGECFFTLDNFQTPNLKELELNNLDTTTMVREINKGFPKLKKLVIFNVYRSLGKLRLKNLEKLSCHLDLNHLLYYKDGKIVTATILSTNREDHGWLSVPFKFKLEYKEFIENNKKCEISSHDMTLSYHNGGILLTIAPFTIKEIQELCKVNKDNLFDYLDIHTYNLNSRALKSKVLKSKVVKDFIATDK